MKGPRMDADAQPTPTWPPARPADAVVTRAPMRAADPDHDRHEEEQHPPDEPGYGHGV